MPDPNPPGSLGDEPEQRRCGSENDDALGIPPTVSETSEGDLQHSGTTVPTGQAIYVDGDACPVRQEVYRVAARLSLDVHVVSNGSRGVRLPDMMNVRRVIVAEGVDAADHWIAERIGPGDVCVTADVPLAARCLAAGGRAIAPSGKVWDDSNIGGALAGREVSRHLREMGAATRGPTPFGPKERARFLQALDATLRDAIGPVTTTRPLPDFFE